MKSYEVLINRVRTHIGRFDNTDLYPFEDGIQVLGKKPRKIFIDMLSDVHKIYVQKCENLLLVSVADFCSLSDYMFGNYNTNLSAHHNSNNNMYILYMKCFLTIKGVSVWPLYFTASFFDAVHYFYKAVHMEEVFCTKILPQFCSLCCIPYTV